MHEGDSHCRGLKQQGLRPAGLFSPTMVCQDVMRFRCRISSIILFKKRPAKMSLSNTEDLSLESSRFETSSAALQAHYRSEQKGCYGAVLEICKLDITCPLCLGESDPNLGHLESSVSFICT